MYLEHFQLQQKPFSLTPDRDMFYLGDAQQKALNTLAIALQQGEGFIKISGEVGTGKTTLCRKLIAMLGESYHVAHINNSFVNPCEFKLLLAHELGVALNHDVPSYRILLHIQKQLVHLARQNKKVVLIIDEAQAMPRDTLEALRLISNLETGKRKLIQIILLGQPELDELLARQDMRQLNQRIAYQAELKAMDKVDAMSYLATRVKIAGGHEDLFTEKAKSLLFRFSLGNPRILNILADKALMCAFAKGAKQVSKAEVEAAAADSKAAIGTKERSLPNWALAACLAAAIIIPGGLGLWM
ncbi:AAA family ATPase [uncultured Pseudoteredinibacter sp.]|uniref:ExeA family protein n=1 Tax=uncultured Pseudoteredinibacter sp. TaxID=1641701 RepID=UPI0026163815|nr:AAA family ATPase [uncultured Pseudoteredinibacter sp.]